MMSARQIHGRNWVAVCLSLMGRVGCGQVSWSLLGHAPLLLGKTWIWPEVSNYSFVTIYGKLKLRTPFGNLGLGWRLPEASSSLGLRTVRLGTSRGEGAARFPEQSPYGAGRNSCYLHYLHWGGWKAKLFLLRLVPRGLCWLPLSRPKDCEALLRLSKLLPSPPAGNSCASRVLVPVPRWESARQSSRKQDKKTTFLTAKLGRRLSRASPAGDTAHTGTQYSEREVISRRSFRLSYR
ncbi:uncharacterized protein LOC118500291 isoform X2 [Phyllostomus discolor]|uniref:Uncharacterized protein LOC118500291 isoform X2 n=1 Tax=Phyllostomus discolor TaxID=89673 RepID=A0A7E6DNM3_9CHIR|nr:uncharacterized protein LOC118500291 isoform X2 [Phyllostomus discolor]